MLQLTVARVRSHGCESFNHDLHGTAAAQAELHQCMHISAKVCPSSFHNPLYVVASYRQKVIRSGLEQSLGYRLGATAEKQSIRP